MNEDEFVALTRFAHARGMDMTFIEVMPLGETRRRRARRPISAAARACASGSREAFTLEEIDYRTGGPARYMRVAETGGRIGFITPLTHNFCESCNRVRVTCTGTLFMCLGQEDAADLRAPLRASADDALLHAAIEAAIARKPKGHDFVIDRATPGAGGLPPYEHDRRLTEFMEREKSRRLSRPWRHGLSHGRASRAARPSRHRLQSHRRQGREICRAASARKRRRRPRAAATGADFVFSCVGNDDDLRAVTLGTDGAFAGMKPGAIFVDHTTASARGRARAPRAPPPHAASASSTRRSPAGRRAPRTAR